MKNVLLDLKRELEMLEGCDKGFYHDYFDEDEGPISKNSLTDCYDDGFKAGYDQGRYDLVLELLKDLQ